MASMTKGKKWGDVDDDAPQIGSLSVTPTPSDGGNIPPMDFDPASLGNPDDFVSKREVFTVDGQPAQESQKIHSWAVFRENTHKIYV
jgi:hypothetical protein